MQIVATPKLVEHLKPQVLKIRCKKCDVRTDMLIHLQHVLGWDVPWRCPACAHWQAIEPIDLNGVKFEIESEGKVVADYESDP